jgi:hypothetical protein
MAQLAHHAKHAQINVQGVAMMTQLIKTNKTASVSFKNNMTVLFVTASARLRDDLSKTRLSASPNIMAKKITATKLASLKDMKMLDVIIFSKTPSYTCTRSCCHVSTSASC